jgi:DNA invertase Pin-like site-specific DNA recombinase
MRYFIYCRKSSEAEDRQVASIESQLTTLKRTFGDRPDIEIVQIYEEAFSAKAPGRVQFGEMLSRIEKGQAEGIIAWAPDRLARNSIDGGSIIYMLDRGLIRDLKFATYTFENNSQGKFMLQIMFGQSKYYSDALSDNVKRGNRTKIEKGWRPGNAPIGYDCKGPGALFLNPPDVRPHAHGSLLTATHLGNRPQRVGFQDAQAQADWRETHSIKFRLPDTHLSFLCRSPGVERQNVSGGSSACRIDRRV